MRQRRTPWRRRRYQGDRRLQRLRTMSKTISIAILPAAFAAASGQPIAEWAFGAVLLAGIVVAFLQRGYGYQRTMFVLLGCAALGFVVGDAAWPVMLS